jgi:hypothetical protein
VKSAPIGEEEIEWPKVTGLDAVVADRALRGTARTLPVLRS